VVRRLWMAAAVMAGLACAAPASAQRVQQNGRWVSMPHRSGPMVMPNHRGQRWPMVNGRWSAGWQAPGGWNAYRRLGRGAALPGYWMSYRIPDYLSFGLAAPPRGYGWVRYYDDAVLVDDGGRVWDSVGGIAWAGAESGWGGSYSNSESYSSAQVGTTYAQPIAPVDPDAYYDDRGAYDYAEPIPAPHAGGYAPPVVAPRPPAVQVQALPPGCIQACSGGYGAYQSGSYYSGGTYGYGAAAGTTVIITTPVTTTTTVIEEEVIEEEVVSTSYVRSAPRRVVRRAPVKKYRPKPKAKSCCVCVCR
jgi:Ni/Co efflux regulator RcnB